MTYEENTKSQHSGHNYQGFGWATAPGFNPPKLFAVLAGFAIFPPLGVAALAYFWWNSRRSRWDGPAREFGGRMGHGCGRGRGFGRGFGRSGNSAFDQHSEKIMNDLAQERQAFHEHRAELRRKRDQEAFDGFQASRTAKDEPNT